jgi:hydrogenase maturation protease
MKKYAVIGIGNILRKDDGVGVHVIKELEKQLDNSFVELVDGGTSTLDMLGYFLDYEKVVVIDCLRAGYKPGTIYKIKPEEIKDYNKENLSIHDVQILDVVKIANMFGKHPQVMIFGVEPKEISFDLEISDTIKNKIPEVVNLVKLELNIN